MSEMIIDFLLRMMHGFNSLTYGNELIAFVVSMFPIVELRGGLPLAISILEIAPLNAYIICVIGNLVPVPFILWLITPIFNLMKKTDLFRGLVEKIEAKADSKKDKIEKVEFWGLLLFVGIPLPGTGAWTGSLIAAMLNMDKKKALVAVTLGVLLAGIIMLLPSFLLKGILV